MRTGETAAIVLNRDFKGGETETPQTGFVAAIDPSPAQKAEDTPQ